MPSGAIAAPITLTVTVSGAASGTLTNTATVSGGSQLDTSDDTATDSVEIAPSADLSFSKTADTLTPTVGQNAAERQPVGDPYPRSVIYAARRSASTVASSTTGTDGRRRDTARTLECAYLRDAARRKPRDHDPGERLAQLPRLALPEVRVRRAARRRRRARRLRRATDGIAPTMRLAERARVRMTLVQPAHQPVRRRPAVARTTSDPTSPGRSLWSNVLSHMGESTLLGPYASGTELVFGLVPRSYCAEATPRASNAGAARIALRAPEVWDVWCQDQQDNDFDDLVVRVEVLPVAPEARAAVLGCRRRDSNPHGSTPTTP